MDYAIETCGLVKKFYSLRGVFGMLRWDGKGSRFVRETVALDGIDLQVPRGSVYGLLGRNGAGKTTTVYILSGLLEPTAGTVSVLGLNPLTQDVELKRRLGIVADGQKMYEFFTVYEICRFCSTFYPKWNKAIEDELIARFDLPSDRKLKELSRGMKAQVALILALAHEPEILLMDESTSGLDAVIRRQFLEAIVEMAHGEGRTVLLSSHIIDDMERVCDWVGVIHHGNLIVQMPLDRLKASVKQLYIRFERTAPQNLNGFAGRVLRWRRNEQELLITVEDYSPSLLDYWRCDGVKSVEVIDLSLEDIFVAYTAPTKVMANQIG